MCNQKNVLFKILTESVNVILHKHKPTEEKYGSNNQFPISMKNWEKVTLQKQIFKYKKWYWQKSDIVSLLKIEKNIFYSNLVTKVVTDNRVSWKTVKPFLSENVTKHPKINLNEDDRITSPDNHVAQKF